MDDDLVHEMQYVTTHFTGQYADMDELICPTCNRVVMVHEAKTFVVNFGDFSKSAPIHAIRRRPEEPLEVVENAGNLDGPIAEFIEISNVVAEFVEFSGKKRC